MACNRCGRRTSRRLCRDCDREQRQEDRVDVDYGWAVDTDEDTDDSDDENATVGVIEPCEPVEEGGSDE